MAATRRFLISLSVVVALVVVAPVAEAQTAPEADTVHTSAHWSWTGPSTWTTVDGTYGITINGTASNRAVLDEGFSTILCSGGATWNDSVTNYFKAKRQGLRSQGFVITSTTAIAHPAAASTNYRRQVVRWRKGTGASQRTGKFIFDYDFTTNVDGLNYCFANNVGLYSLTSKWTTMEPKLNAIYGSLAYFGPGGCDPSAPPC